MENKKNTSKKNGILKTLATWLRRMVLGASKDMAMDDRFVVEKLESPSKMAVKAFFRRKLAVVALIVLVSLFLFVLIGPKFFPMDASYTDSLQANLAPNYTYLKVPAGLKDNIKTINGFGSFTIGISKDNKFYIWGSTKESLTNIDFAAIPEDIKDGGVFTAAAGTNHVIAITTEGKVIGWGDNTTGQYGYVTEQDQQFFQQMPEELITGTVDVNQVQQLVAGYQATALVMKDGTMYLWGNKNALMNMKDIIGNPDAMTNVQKVALGNYYGLILKKDGTLDGMSMNKRSGVSSTGEKIPNLRAHLIDKKVVDIAATDNCYALILENGELIVFGADEHGEKQIPMLPEGAKYVSVTGGTRHFVAVSDQGLAYTWGLNDSEQASLSGVEASQVFAGAKQTYLVNAEGELTEAVGFKGYLMGTDKYGRDIFTRIIHGGKMTMTIGAVAVIVSSVIAIIVGCLSGYFGGWVDMLLMRITEIFSAVPFLPFAMMLSYIIRTMSMEETTRIFIIMVMLGLLSWTGLARMIRGQVLAEREKEFVIAAQSMGVKESRIAFKHILPNVISVILVSMTLDFAGCLLTESSLSYLGFGVQPPRPTWGNMLDGANTEIVIQNYWWQWVFPALFLSIATISINIIGDTLRDVLDPKSSQEK